MTRQEQLLGEWRRRLADCESRLGRYGGSDAQMPGAWLTRMYARVLRYLIRRYERADEAEAFREVAAVRPPRRTAETQAASADRPPVYSRGAMEEWEGRPARTAERIRATLDAVHERVPQPAAGPLAVGLTPNDWMLAAALKNAAQANWLRHELALMGIPVRRSLWLSGDVRVWVQRRDFDRAQRAVVRVPAFRARSLADELADRLFANRLPSGTILCEAQAGDSILWLVSGLAIGFLLGFIAGAAVINQGLLPATLNGRHGQWLFLTAAIGTTLGPLFGWLLRFAARAVTLPLRMRRRLDEGKSIDDHMT